MCGCGCRPKGCPSFSSLLFIIPSFSSGFISSWFEKRDKEKHGYFAGFRHPDEETQHLKQQRDREISSFSSFSFPELKWPAQNSSYARTPQDLRLDQDIHMRLGAHPRHPRLRRVGVGNVATQSAQTEQNPKPILRSAEC